MKLLKKQRLIYGSDASVNDQFQGSFAWGIMDKQNENSMFIQYNAQLHGDTDQTHSTRGELFGILGCMRHLDYITTKYKFKLQHKIPIYTDSQSAIKISKTPPYISYKEAFCSDADIKSEVQHYYKKLRNCMSLHYVKAHQDDKTEFKYLSTAGKLNTLMDRHAKTVLLIPTKIKHRRLIPHLPHQKVSLKSKFNRITTDVASNINKYKIGHECEQWLGSRWKLSESQMMDIEWIDLKHVLGSVKGLRRTQFIKIVHKYWATNKRQHKWNQVDSPNCPFCKDEVEDREHILQCKNIVAKSHRTELLVELKKIEEN